MITQKQYEEYSSELKEHINELANCSWNKIQNDGMDEFTKPWTFKNFQDLMEKIKNFPKNLQEYAKTRYFKFRCAMCDEYLFGINPEVFPHPNPRSKEYDFKILDFPFDLKGTRIFQDKSEEEVKQILMDPSSLIPQFYTDQSKGTREGFQNRLFLIHYSFKDPLRNDFLRIDFDFKQKAIYSYIQLFKEGQIELYPVEKDGQIVYGSCLYILEDKDGQITYWTNLKK